jgi:hypothetical protein
MKYQDFILMPGHNNLRAKKLIHNFGELSNFLLSPSLLNWKSEPDAKAFISGNHSINKYTIIIIASDALSQYILGFWLILHGGETGSIEIQKLVNSNHRLSHVVGKLNLQLQSKRHFYKDVLKPLIRSLSTVDAFKEYVTNLVDHGMLGKDDYSMVVYRF